MGWRLTAVGWNRLVFLRKCRSMPMRRLKAQRRVMDKTTLIFFRERGMKMKKLAVLLLALFLLPLYEAWGEGRDGGTVILRSPLANRQQPMVVHQPLVINMNRGSSGGQNRNFPNQQPQAHRQPSYGQLHWDNPPAARPQPQTAAPADIQEGVISPRVSPRPSVRIYSRPGVKAAVAVHHHAYTQGYVRRKLQKLGVDSEPSLITDRSEMVETDRAHSTISFPIKEPDHQGTDPTMVSPRHFNDDVVRDQMGIVDNPKWQDRADQLDANENQAGHYYWHDEEGFNYCHYRDASGYDWYGWYVGSQYFWTRHFNGRWWWYDTDFDRWCFWNNGFWWWQDPYHVGDLYCYNNDNYIPCNSAEDQIVVTAPDGSGQQVFNSPDGTRQVKLTPDSQDAFLYDTALHPAFDPLYLASGVQSVQFSGTGNGRPLEIILKLNDGSFDMFDSQGNSYNPGAFDADQASSNDSQPPGNGNGGNNPSNAQILQKMDATPNSGIPTDVTFP